MIRILNACRRLLPVAALLFITSASCSANLLLNPGFESGITDAISYWTNWKSDWGTYLYRTCTSSTKVSGNKCLWLSTKDCSFGVYQQVTVTPGRAYQVDGWWRGLYGSSGMYWFDCELLDGPFDLTIADSRPQDLPYKFATYDPPTTSATSWGWQRMSDAYYTTKQLQANEIAPQNICRNGIRIATTNKMIVLLKTGAYNNPPTAATCYYDDMSLEEVPSLSVVDAKKQADKKAVMLEGVVVSYVSSTGSSGYVYVQPSNRTAGIKVLIEYPFTAAVGQTAKIAGVLRTDATTNERYIECSYISCSGSGTVKPVATNIKSLSLTWDGTSSSTLGLLVRTAGEVQYGDAHTFTLNDGSGDTVKCVTPSNVTVNSAWKFASVTGISSYYMQGTNRMKMLMVRSLSDIVQNK